MFTSRLILVLVACFSLPSYAGWTKVKYETRNGSNFYLDLDSVKPEGELISVPLLTDFDSPQKLNNGILVGSTVTDLVINCKGSFAERIVTGFSGKSGEGQIVGKNTSAQLVFNHISRNSVTSQIMNEACDSVKSSITSNKPTLGGGAIDTSVDGVLTPQKLYEQGLEHEKKRKYKEAFAVFLKAAQSGHADAQAVVGFYYVGPELDQATTMVIGDARGDRQIKIFEGSEKNFRIGYDWIQQASKNGSGLGDFYNYAFYTDGLPHYAGFELMKKVVEPNYEIALNYLDKAYQKGVIDLMMYASACNILSKRSPTNPVFKEKSIDLFKKYVMAEDIKGAPEYIRGQKGLAAWNVAISYEKAKDIEMTKNWMKKSASFGDKFAIKYISEHKW